MFHRAQFPVLLLLLPVLLVACGDDGGGASAIDVKGVTAQPAPQDELSLLFPEGAIALVRFNDLGGLEKEIYDLARAMDPDDQNTVLISEGLGAQLMNPGMKGVALDRPLGIAVFMGESGEPTPIFLLPIASKAKYMAVLEANQQWGQMQESFGLSFLAGDTWAAFGPDKAIVDGIEMRDAPTALAKKLLDGQVSAGLDLVALNEMLAPKLDQMAGMGGMPPGMEMMGAMMEGMLKGVKKFLADSSALCISGSLTEGSVALTVRYDARDGTETAESIASGSSVKPVLIHSLGLTDFAAAEFYFDPESLWDLMAPMYQAMYGENEEMLALMEKGFSMSDGMAFGMNIADGLEVVAISRLTDPEAYSDYVREMQSKMVEMIDSLSASLPTMPMGFETLPEWEHEGHKVLGMKMTMDFSSMPGAPAPMGEFMGKFFGDDGLKIYYSVVGNLGVSVTGPGGESLMKELIDRVAGGKTVALPAAYTDATAGFPETVKGVFYMNLGDVAKLVADLAPEGVMNPAQVALLKSPPSDLYAAGYVRAEGPSVTFGMRLRLGQIMKYVKAVIDSEN